MDELAAATPEQQPRRWSDTRWLLLLLALTVPLRGWLLSHTEVAARDSIGFIRYALQFQTTPWATVVRTNHQHPGYPLTVLAVSVPVRQLIDRPDTVRMQLSAQLASGLAAVLLIFPMFYLGKRLFNARAGFWATLLFQCLPVTGHILSDGLSEALFLLLTATTLCLAAQALDTRSSLRFALCGVCCGLTYLTRPEGLLLVVTVLFMLGVMQSVARVAAARLVVRAVRAGADRRRGAGRRAYVAATGRFSTKPSVQQFLSQKTDESPTTAAGPLLAVVLPTAGEPLERLGLGVWSLGAELVKAFHYAGWLPTLLGMICYAGRTRRVPVMGAVVTLCCLHALVLWRLAVVVGYLSDRHIQLLVMGGVYPAAAFLLDAPPWLLHRLRLLPTPGQPQRLLLRPALWSLVLLAALIGSGMPKTLQPLHANRAGHHAAGLWLAGHLQPHDLIEDSHCWAHYYAGLVFEESKPRPPVPPGALRVLYSVVSRARDNDPNGLRSRDLEETVRERGGAVVYHYPPQRPVVRADVVIYAQPLPAASPAP